MDDKTNQHSHLVLRVEEQSTRIAELVLELEDLRIQKAESEALVKRQAETISEVKGDARRLAQEVVRIQAELEKGGPAPNPGSENAPAANSALQEVLDGYQDQTARLRGELATVNRALATLKVSYREVESEILALQRASSGMIATQYLDEVLQSILTGLEEGLGYDLAVLMVLDRPGGFYFPRTRPENILMEGMRAETGRSLDKLRIPLTASDNVLARLIEDPKLVVTDSPLPMLTGAEPAEDAQKLGAYLVTKGERIFAAVPMVVRGEVAGALLCTRSRAALSARERESLQNFSNQAGMAIENIQLVTDMSRVRDELAGKNKTLLQTNEKLLELERTKEALTSMMVHDMKNPLTSIRGYLELLLDEPEERLSDTLKRHVRISYDSSGRLLEMVRELLDISKMEAGKFKLASQPVDLKALIDAAYTEQSVLADRSKKMLAVNVHPDTPAITGDFDLIGRVIVNLVSNSVKHTPRGSRIEVSARPAILVDGAPLNAAVVISISDNGEGIPKEFHEKIFEKFGSIEPRSTGAPKLSTGLGLTFCKMAVDAHGGKIWVESEPGAGATFHVAFRESPPPS